MNGITIVLIIFLFKSPVKKYANPSIGSGVIREEFIMFTMSQEATC